MSSNKKQYQQQQQQEPEREEEQKQSMEKSMDDFIKQFLQKTKMGQTQQEIDYIRQRTPTGQSNDIKRYALEYEKKQAAIREKKHRDSLTNARAKLEQLGAFGDGSCREYVLYGTLGAYFLVLKELLIPQPFPTLWVRAWTACNNPLPQCFTIRNDSDFTIVGGTVIASLGSPASPCPLGVGASNISLGYNSASTNLSVVATITGDSTPNAILPGETGVVCLTVLTTCTLDCQLNCPIAIRICPEQGIELPCPSTTPKVDVQKASIESFLCLNTLRITNCATATFAQIVDIVSECC